MNLTKSNDFTVYQTESKFEYIDPITTDKEFIKYWVTSVPHND